jgi:hypothetical protein
LYRIIVVGEMGVERNDVVTKLVLGAAAFRRRVVTYHAPAIDGFCELA